MLRNLQETTLKKLAISMQGGTCNQLDPHDYKLLLETILPLGFTENK